MYKIYINDLPFIITVPEKSYNFQGAAIISPFIYNPKILINYIDLLEKQKPDYGGVVLTTSTPERAFDLFKSLFTLVEAAGGLVNNDDKEYLFIYRYGKWDLPKGVIEVDESPDIAALREVKEETGVDCRNKMKLCLTYHSYRIEKERFLKTTHWYAMQCLSDIYATMPQLEEGITEVSWVKMENIENKIKKNTYKNILQVLSHTH